MSSEHAQLVDHAITSRRSIRAYLDKPVEPHLIQEILQVASRAPSGTNTQLWKVYVVTSKTRRMLIDRVCQAQIELFQHPVLITQYGESFAYYPETWISPYIEHRRENGWGLYGLLGIQKGEKEKMAAQQLRNFQLFDAPVGLFFTVDHSMEIGAKMDTAC